MGAVIVFQRVPLMHPTFPTAVASVEPCCVPLLLLQVRNLLLAANHAQFHAPQTQHSLC